VRTHIRAVDLHSPRHAINYGRLKPF